MKFTGLLVDYLFIVGYVVVGFMISDHLMQKEKDPFLNGLLRLCFPLLILAGLLGVVENAIVWVSWPKWALAAVILFIWLIDLLHKLTAPPPPLKHPKKQVF
jgi:hypothetical protein